jgi:hypothetical protein
MRLYANANSYNGGVGYLLEAAFTLTKSFVNV